ncbi:hypothetical protein CEV33_3698 [Brucella grignonensis]|uniref:Uncharacterized protein n=1 Tax=Brucella grignonensis TaxID=94627 RepID=A0A256EXW8_9HYPH|nr:hypothetical protein CEV33_3698 [Brucella grignonensis]
MLKRWSDTFRSAFYLVILTRIFSENRFTLFWMRSNELRGGIACFAACRSTHHPIFHCLNN